MLEITRELVEHYLRATGWTLDDGWWYGKDWDGNGQRGFPASWLGATTLDIDVVVRITGHSKHLASLAFRLGLCAAADRAFAQGREFRAIHQGAWAMKSDDLAVDYLTGAGIDPAAWESARKR